ncbi:hypothetical protein [Streptomyces sp. NPDC002785]|uniref:hypothetical protein n=1 Tax=Streptomyces sp. NPDC002785 TaxID=3154543 RepID=UPI003326B779
MREERSESIPEAEASRARRAWQWVRRASWTHVITVSGAVLAAIAAIGGLWAQGVGTYWGQETAKDQLAQSKDDDARRARKQAEKVTYWGGGGSAFEWGGTGMIGSASDGSGALHVLNRSPDPIPYMHIGIEINKKDLEGDIERSYWYVALRNLPPCTHLEYREYDLQLGSIQADLDPPTLSNQKGIWSPIVMRFTDAGGVDWLRTKTSLKKGGASKLLSEAIRSKNSIVGSEAKKTKAGSCNDR